MGRGLITFRERGRKLIDQLELQLEELAASAAEDEAAAEPTVVDPTSVSSFTRKKPVRLPFPAHLPRERVVIPGPVACPCCGGKLAKLGETITETLDVVPRQWKVIQTVREKFTPAFAGAGSAGRARRSPSRRRRSTSSPGRGRGRACWR